MTILDSAGGAPVWYHAGGEGPVLVTEPGAAPPPLSGQRADLLEQLDSCCRELLAARADLDEHAGYCARNRLLQNSSVLARLREAVLHAEQQTGQQHRLLARAPTRPAPAGAAERAEQAEQAAAGESAVRFALATLAFVRGALEWCSPSYAQSRAVQFFDTEAQDSATVNYERYDNPPLRRVERQLLDTLGLSPDLHGVCATSSGVAAYTLVESFLLRERLRPGDTVLIAPYIYFEAAEQLTSLPFVHFEHSAGYAVEDFADAVVRHRPRCVFADPVANTAEQRMVDLAGLLRRLREVGTDRTTVVVDGTMLSGGLPPQLLASDERVEVLYYESGSKYLQLGMDAGMAGVVAYPVALKDRFERLRRNTGSVLYRHGAELFPRYQRAFYQRRMRRIGANALRMASLLRADPRVQAAGQVYYPGLADHPDAAIAQQLPYAGGCVTFLFHQRSRNDRDALNAVFDDVLTNARAVGVQLTKGASFGFSVPRVSAADAFADGEPPFLRLYVGDRGEQVELLAEALARALANTC
jgi:cystathionine gamma-synthase